MVVWAPITIVEGGHSHKRGSGYITGKIATPSHITSSIGARGPHSTIKFNMCIQPAWIMCVLYYIIHVEWKMDFQLFIASLESLILGEAPLCLAFVAMVLSVHHN